MKLTPEHLKELIEEAIAKEQRVPRNIKNSIFRILQILKDKGPTEARDLPPHLLTIAGASTLKRAVQAHLIAQVPGTEYATYKITERGLEAFPFLRLGMVARNEPINEGISEQADFSSGGGQEDEATLWKYLLWAVTSTTKDPSSTIKELLKKGLRLSDSSSVDSVAGTDVKAQVMEYMKLWQKLQTSKQKLAVTLKLLARDK